MSDTYTTPATDDDGDLTHAGESGDIKDLRRAASKSKTLEAENANLKRELAFVKAGIPTDDVRMSYFVKGYEGDLEPEKIRAAAIEAGFMAPPTEQPDPAVQQAAQGQQRVMQASAGVEAQYDASSQKVAMERAFEQGGVGAIEDVLRQNGIPIVK